MSSIAQDLSRVFTASNSFDRAIVVRDLPDTPFDFVDVRVAGVAAMPSSLSAGDASVEAESSSECRHVELKEKMETARHLKDQVRELEAMVRNRTQMINEKESKIQEAERLIRHALTCATCNHPMSKGFL
ncbi:hypothetical protein BV25DRAFT_1920082 [Artomyces pyxidatus]|uniref:Uncharacterized protein n=1 Tax=Artomyces pyxidatus TaxID=48021 RepID=A0ACB8SNN3_9AGAM|nr:hypothetical protein BV25DRAFT_1920082 [Artomyces pyxidatus]